jgi:excisionase family DNA binding protein
MKNLITLEEYAKHLGVSLKTIYNRINAGKITPIIIGKSKFIKLKK